MHEPKASALLIYPRPLLQYPSAHTKTRRPAKCDLNVLLLIASPTTGHVLSRNRYMLPIRLIQF